MLKQMATICAFSLGIGFSFSTQAMTRAEYNAAVDHAKVDYKAAKAKCDALSGNAKDVCIKEAKAQRTTAESDAKAAFKGTDKASREAREDQAEANYKVAKEKCDALAGNAKDVCIEEAKAQMTKTKATVAAQGKGADARAQANEEKRVADYKVAKEKCDALAGDAKDSCIKSAKTRYGQ